MFEERRFNFEEPYERQRSRRSARAVAIARPALHVSFASAFQIETMLNHLLTLCRSLWVSSRRVVGCDGGRP